MFKVSNYSSTYTLIECLSSRNGNSGDSASVSTNTDMSFHTPPRTKAVGKVSSSSLAVDKNEQEGCSSTINKVKSLSPVYSGGEKPKNKNTKQQKQQKPRWCKSTESILTPQECTNIITHTEQSGLYKPALINVGFGREVYDPDARNSDRCIIDDANFARVIFDRLTNGGNSQGTNQNVSDTDNTNDGMIIPLIHTNSGLTWEAVGLNERFRILRYKEGNAFPWHCDGNYMRNTKERSFYTIMLYLNAGGGIDYTGGSTLFHFDGAEVKGDCERDGVEAEYVPQAGGVVVFDHRILHEGATLEMGTKYAIRTDVMYRLVKE